MNSLVIMTDSLPGRTTLTIDGLIHLLKGIFHFFHTLVARAKMWQTSHISIELVLFVCV